MPSCSAHCVCSLAWYSFGLVHLCAESVRERERDRPICLLCCRTIRVPDAATVWIRGPVRAASGPIGRTPSVVSCLGCVCVRLFARAIDDRFVCSHFHFPQPDSSQRPLMDTLPLALCLHCTHTHKRTCTKNCHTLGLSLTLDHSLTHSLLHSFDLRGSICGQNGRLPVGQYSV